MILMMAMAVICQGQTVVNYGANIDSAGQVYLIRQITTKIGDSTETRAISVRFAKPADALPTLGDMEETIRNDSTEIERLKRQNAVSKRQLSEIRTALQNIINPIKTEKPVETEIERLRRENAELKKGKN